jgi:peptide/nickel transport system substrate-binding protein
MEAFRSFITRKPFRGTIFLLLAYCTGLMTSTPLCLASDADNQHNQLVICVHDSIHKLDPAIHRLRNIQIILKNMLDSLTTRDADMKVVPQLAESWKALDKTSWEFKLRKGVKFHNNDEFTAEDVQFSLERIFKEGGIDGITSPRKALLGPVLEVSIMDRHTVVIKTEKPWPILPLMLSLQEIVPKKYMTRVGSEAFQSHPVGTGPFKFVRLEKNQRIIMERFENYYGGSPAIPPVQNAPLKSLVFKFSPSNSQQIQMLKKNECSIIPHLNPTAIPILKANPTIKILSCPATRSYFAEINCSKPPFDNPRIRQALNYAVNIDKVVAQILQGNGITLPTVLLPNAVGYNTALKPYAYDPELSRQLLAEAGYNKKHILQIHCNKDELQFANNIASFLTRVGVKSQISLVEIREPSLLGKTAQWDIFLGSWGNSTLDPVGIILPKFQSNGRGNFSGYSNQKIDNLLVKAEGTSDLNFRKTCYQKIQEIIYEDAPMIFGYAEMEFFGARKGIKNFIPSSSGMMNMHDVFIETGSDQ